MPAKLLYSLIRPALFAMDPENAHHLTLPALQRVNKLGMGGLLAKKPAEDARTVMGVRFPNPVGLAAGLDKDGAYIDGLAAIGFGSIEIGTVTPRAQAGNPKPRMFRLPEREALINRLGFNNEGLSAFIANVRRARSFRAAGGILGLNIGKNANTAIEDAASDYLLGLDGVYPHADYVTVNISSPNTKNLRALQSDEALDALLGALQQRRRKLAAQHQRKDGKVVPMFVKIAPDLDDAQIKVIAATLKANGIDGVIATNTTINRDAVMGLPFADEAGGLSGGPVFEASNRVIAQLRAELGAGFPVIGVGGVMSGADAQAKITAGADLVQIYTGLIYKGPALVAEAARALAKAH